MLTKVISGGQTGADRAALIAAKAFGLETGGWMPKGFKALDGYHPIFAEMFGIREHSSSLYPPRTYLNVAESDGTLRFARVWYSRGEECTMNAIRKYKKEHLDVDYFNPLTPDQVVDWLIANEIGVLNVAGNSEQNAPGIEDKVIEFLLQVFELGKTRRCLPS